MAGSVIQNIGEVNLDGYAGPTFVGSSHLTTVALSRARAWTLPKGCAVSRLEFE